MGYIYVLENQNGNKKKYVGQTTQKLDRRMNDHKAVSSRGSSLIIHNAIRKYGFNSFKKYGFCVPNNMLDYFEIELIKRLNTIAPCGYNLEAGGHKNKILSESTKEKLRIINIGKAMSQECKDKISKALKGTRTGKNNPMHGKKTKGYTGCIPSEETRNKISLKVSGKNNGMYGVRRFGKDSPHYGIKHSEESKRKMSKSLKEMYTGKRSPFYGKTHTDETKYNFRFRHVKPVIQYDLNNNKIKEYFSMMEAVRKNGFQQAAIQRACCGKQKTSYGYIWKYGG